MVAWTIVRERERGKAKLCDVRPSANVCVLVNGRELVLELVLILELVLVLVLLLLLLLLLVLGAPTLRWTLGH